MWSNIIWWGLVTIGVYALAGLFTILFVLVRAARFRTFKDVIEEINRDKLTFFLAAIFWPIMWVAIFNHTLQHRYEYLHKQVATFMGDSKE